MARTTRKWTKEEEERLLRQVRAFPQNYSKCFSIVGEELNRTQIAVTKHWYSVTSKCPEYLAYANIPPVSVSGNYESVWKKLFNVIRNLF